MAVGAHLKSVKALIWRGMVQNAINRFRLRPGSRILFKKEQKGDEDAREKAGYIRYMFDEYMRFVEGGEQGLEGKRILELGPGDNFGVALLALTKGAKEFVGLDKYAAVRDMEFEQRVYWALRETLSGAEKERFDTIVIIDGGPTFNSDVFRSINDCPIEEAERRLEEEPFDFIWSRSVLEYLKNPDRAFDMMDLLLLPGGMMIHKVDVRDDGMFSAAGHHPLTFLTLSDGTYRRMTSHSYRPNRWPLSFYRSHLARYKYTFQLPVTHILGQAKELDAPQATIKEGREYKRDEVNTIKAIRQGLAEPFKPISTEDLLSAGFFVVAQKKQVSDVL